MRSPRPGTFLLTFLLPDGIVADSGVRAAAAGCKLSIDRQKFVEVSGPSREAVFVAAAEALRGICRGRGPQTMLAILRTPDGAFSAASRGGCDDWSVTVGADVVFSPTPLDPHLPPPQKADAAALVSLPGGRQ